MKWPRLGRKVRFVVGAMAAGLILPALIAASFAFMTYYPVGGFLPPFNFLSGIGTALAIIGVAMWALLGAGLFSLLNWNWRPFVLSLIVVAGMALGFIPALWSHGYLKLLGYDLLGRRSVPLIHAILEFERTHGSPPLTLADLVPAFTPAIPKTGMAAYPDYEYAPEPGPCGTGNKWHLKVDASEVLQWDFFFYCPRRDYTVEGWGGYNEVRGDWAYLHE